MSDEELAAIHERLEAFGATLAAHDDFTNGVSWTDEGAALFCHSPEDLRRLLAEVERLREWKEQIEEDRRVILADAGAPDEQHCSCVPVLRARITELEAVRRREGMESEARLLAYALDAADDAVDLADLITTMRARLTEVRAALEP